MYILPSADDSRNQAPESFEEGQEKEEQKGEGDKAEVIVEKERQEDDVCDPQVNQEHKKTHRKGVKKGQKNATDGTPSSSTDKDEDAAVYAKYLTGLEMPHFIFHAAGHCAKLEALKGMYCSSSIFINTSLLNDAL